MTSVLAQRPILVCKRDRRILFDQLRVTDELVEYFGWPGITGYELLTAGLTLSEWKELRPTGARPCDRVFPCSAVGIMFFLGRHSWRKACRSEH